MRYWIYTKYTLSSTAGEGYSTKEEAEAERLKLLAMKYSTPLPGYDEPNPLYRDYELMIVEGETPPKGTYENEMFYPKSTPTFSDEKIKCWKCGAIQDGVTQRQSRLL